MVILEDSQIMEVHLTMAEDISEANNTKTTQHRYTQTMELNNMDMDKEIEWIGWHRTAAPGV